MTAVLTRVDSYSCRDHVTTCPLPDLVPLQRESSGRLARSGGEIRSRSLGQLAAAPGRACLVKVSTNFVKLRRGSGKDRQGMAVKAKGLKA